MYWTKFEQSSGKGGSDIYYRFPDTTILEFLPAAAWTRIIPLRHNLLHNLIFLIPYPCHYIGRGTFVFKLFSMKSIYGSTCLKNIL